MSSVAINAQPSPAHFPHTPQTPSNRLCDLVLCANDILAYFRNVALGKQMPVDVAHASTSACGTFASRCGLWLRAAWRIGQACKGRKEGKMGAETKERRVSVSWCLGASVCYISCSHFEFFKWLLGPAHTHTHIHTLAQSISQIHSERDFLTCIEQSKAC